MHAYPAAITSKSLLYTARRDKKNQRMSYSHKLGYVINTYTEE